MRLGQSRARILNDRNPLAAAPQVSKAYRSSAAAGLFLDAAKSGRHVVIIAGRWPRHASRHALCSR